jgi:beta-lactamase class A
VSRVSSFTKEGWSGKARGVTPYKRFRVAIYFSCLITMAPGCSRKRPVVMQQPSFEQYVLDYDTPIDPGLQARLEGIDGELRGRLGMTDTQAAAGVLDLRSVRLAALYPDREEYAASVAKIGILLAYFALRPETAGNLPVETRHELGLMAKASSNEMAEKYSRELGLHKIQEVLNANGFYDVNRGGGLWVGKHYGAGEERYGDPLGNHSHAATVRQVMRFFLLLEQGKLVSPEASKRMREIFASPELPHDQIKFVKALADRPGVEILRKWGSWKEWLHDAAIVTGPNRHYILVGMTRHPKGDEYLEGLARMVDDTFIAGGDTK